MLFRPNIPAELDVLDSPLLEFGQSPLASAMFGRMPGSALAERIFNDPSAWGTSEDLGYDESEDDDEGVEISFDASGLDKSEVETARMDSSTTPTKSDSKARLLDSPQSQQRQPRMGIQRHKVRPISLTSLFQHGSEEAFLSNVQSNLRKFSNEGGIERTPATSDIFSPMTDSTGTPGTANTDMTMFSPSPLYSASTTLSFLDLYLDSPKLNMRKSLYAKRQSQIAGAKPTTPALVIPSQPVPRRPLTILTPLSAHPDMSVEPTKRGGSVPPLDQISINLLPPPSAQQQKSVDSNQQQRQPSKLPSPPTSVLSPEPKLSLPPGLGHAGVATLQPTPKKTLVSKENVATSATTPPRSLPRPVLHQTEQPRRPSTSLSQPPPYSRTPSPPRDSSDPSRPPSSSSVRRLPTIPLKSAAFAPLSSMTTLSPALSTGRTLLGAPSPLPSSLPSSVMSPEPTPGGQTIVFHSRASSTVRSPPLGGPMGPRSKSDRNSRHTPSPTAKRVVSGGNSGLAVRRPPGLML